MSKTMHKYCSIQYYIIFQISCLQSASARYGSSSGKNYINHVQTMNYDKIMLTVYSLIKKDGLNFVRLYFLNCT